MSELSHRGLLPAGLRDSLPPDADREAEIENRLLRAFADRGYDRVAPPLIEFEEGLFDGPGMALRAQTFRLMDPVSQRMMGLRADMTMQIARIAGVRLENAPRPLRLSYGGQVLRVRASQMRPSRQFGQVGIELIGPVVPAADVEVILSGVAALDAVNINALSVDLNMPTLVPALCAGLDLDAETIERLRAALDRKDAAAVAGIGGRAAALLGAMLAAAGPARDAMAALEALDLPSEAATERRRLSTVVDLVLQAAPDLRLTVDPVENRGFEYHTGISFTFFGLGTRGTLGRGGRYRTRHGNGEPATGLTLFMDTVVAAAPKTAGRRRIYLPPGTPFAAGARLRDEGWITIDGIETDGIEAVTDAHAGAHAEARRLGCTHAYIGDAVEPVD